MLRNVGGFFLTVITIFTTVVAAYELLSENRHVPYASAEVSVCGSNETELSGDVHQTIVGNVHSVVYLDILYRFDCENGDNFEPDFEAEEEQGIPSINVASDEGPLPSATLEMSESSHANSLLSSFGEPGLDINAARFQGLVYLKGEIEGGHYSLEGLPVPFSSNMLLKRNCSQSLERSRALLNKVEGYFRTCIFEQPWNPWGWGSES